MLADVVGADRRGNHNPAKAGRGASERARSPEGLPGKPKPVIK